MKLPLSNAWRQYGRATVLRRPVIEITPGRQAIFSVLRDIWMARRLLAHFVRRDLKARYRSTFLGNWWVLVRPVAEILPYLIVFGLFLKMKPGPLPYVVFLISGFAPWLFLGGVLSASPSAMAKTRSLISKIYFPRLIMPLNDLLTRLIDYMVVLSASIIIALIYGIIPGREIWALPLFVLLTVALALGASLIVITVCTLRPDLAHAVPAATRFLFYASAIIYPLAIVPEPFRSWFVFNPIATLVYGIRWSLFGFDQPSWLAIGIAVASTAGILWLGMYMFLRLEQRLADVL